MSALRDYPPLSLVEAPVRRPSRLRLIIAVLLLSAMGLLAAASGFASRHYQPAPRPHPVYPPVPPALPGSPGPAC